jgi:hypothetical protein
VELGLRLGAEAGEEPGDLVEWTVQLEDVLGDLDGVDLDHVAQAAPDGAKGIAIGALLAKLPTKALLAKAVETIRAFAARTGRTVKVTLDGDTLEITGATREEQSKVIEAWLARHAAGA